MSLKFQITLFVILLVAGLVSVFSWTVANTEKQMILSEMAQRAVLQGRNLALSAAKPLLHPDPEFELHWLIARLLRSKADIVSIIVIDRSGKIVGHSDLTEIGQTYHPTVGITDVQDVDFLYEGELLRENDDFLEVGISITDQDEEIGFVYLQYSKSKFNYAILDMESRILRVGLMALAGGAIVALLLALYITKPVSILTRSAEAIGQGDLDTRISVRSGREIQTLASTFNEMARKLKASQQSMLEKERMEKELEIAQTIQETLLPSNLPHLMNFEIDAYYHPASQVGGDYFDLIEVDDRHLMIVVGDVAGKGVPGLVVMAMVRILVRDLALRRESPGRLLRHLNILLRKDIRKNLFVTLFCGLMDRQAGTLQFASAAHMPLIVFHGREHTVRQLGTKTKPLGFFSDREFAKSLEEKVIDLKPGDLFMQFTDGLTEMRNETGEEFGIERVMQIAIDEAAGGARHMLSVLRKKLEVFRGGEPRSDDLTLLAVSALQAGMTRAPEDRMEVLDKVVFE